MNNLALTVSVLMTSIRPGQSVCRQGCCIHQMAIAVEVQEHSGRQASARGLSFPGDPNTTMYLVDTWVQVCFRCTGVPSATCPWAATPRVYVKKHKDTVRANVASAVRLCGDGYTDHVKAGYYHCMIPGQAMTHTEAMVVDQMKCLLPPPVHDAIMKSYQVKDMHNGFGDTILYMCRDNHRQTKVSTCERGIPLGEWSKVDHVCDEPQQCLDYTPEMCRSLNRHNQLCLWGHPMNLCQKTCGVCDPIDQPVVKAKSHDSSSLDCVDQNKKSPGARESREADYAYHDYDYDDDSSPQVSLSHEWLTPRRGIQSTLTPADLRQGHVQCRARIGWKVSAWSKPYAVGKHNGGLTGFSADDEDDLNDREHDHDRDEDEDGDDDNDQIKDGKLHHKSGDNVKNGDGAKNGNDTKKGQDAKKGDDAKKDDVNIHTGAVNVADKEPRIMSDVHFDDGGAGKRRPALMVSRAHNTAADRCGSTRVLLLLYTLLACAWPVIVL